MQRFGRVLRIRPGMIEDYERQHEAVWPEVLAEIERQGLHNYTIFRHDHWLFSFFELPDGVSLEEATAGCMNDEASLRWEEMMQKIQEPLPESEGNNWWVPMKEVFHHN